MSFRINWDSLGISTSLLCAIHCAILPLLFTSVPLFGVNIIHNEAFEWMMIAIAFLIGVYALSHGFNKHHHSKLPIALFSAGILLLVAKQLLHDHQIILLVPAVILIVTAHIVNFRMCSRCKACEHHKH